jgi:hypothetical protein
MSQLRYASQERYMPRRRYRSRGSPAVVHARHSACDNCLICRICRIPCDTCDSPRGGRYQRRGCISTRFLENGPARLLHGVLAPQKANGRGNQVTRCPICKSEAAEIDRGLLDGVGFDCRFHGRFRVSGTVLAQGKRRTRRQWEHALMLARARASDGLPLINSELL